MPSAAPLQRLLLVLILGVLASLPLGCGEGEGDPLIGSEGPEFILPELLGAEISLPRLRGRIVVIDFWATWCSPCLFQIPVLNAITESYPAHEVIVLGIAVDVEGASRVAPYAEEQGIQYPVLLGDEALAMRYGAPGFPYLVILGPDGRIAYRHTGVVGLSALQEVIQDLSDGGH